MSERAEGVVRCAGVSAALLLLALASAAASPRPPVQPPPASVLKTAERLIEEGEFEDAVRRLRALTVRQTLSRSTQVESYYLLGWAYLYLGDRPSARAAYQRLLHLDRSFSPPASASPILKQLLEQARRDLLAPSSSLSFSRVSFLRQPRVPRYRGPDPIKRSAKEREVASRPAVSNIAGWTHWIEPARLP